MRLGVAVPHFGPLAHREEVLQIGDAVERLGFASLWTTDHIVVPTRFPEPYGQLLESLTTLAVIAGRTSRIRLGTSVIVAAQRELLLLAKQTATIHELSGGRLTLGIGTGWLEEEFIALGADFGARGATTDESIEALRTIWSNDVPRFVGEHRRVEGVITSPRIDPARPISITIGGTSPAALRRAARLGDGWHADNLRPDGVRERLAQLRTMTDRPIEVSLRLHVAPGRTVRDPEMREAGLSGTPDAILERLREHAAAGVDHVVLVPDARTGADLLRDLESLAAGVLPFVPKDRSGLS